MRKIIRIIYALLLVCVAAFSAFGFMATFEPMDQDVTTWRIAYAAVGVGAIIAALWLLVPGKPKTDTAGNGVGSR